MSAKEKMAKVAESAPATKENNTPITQAISAKQKQTVVSDVVHPLKDSCRM